MTKAVWGSGIRCAMGIMALIATTSCGEMVRQGEGSSFLLLNDLSAASGAAPETFGNNLASDIITVVDNVSTVFADPGRAQFELAAKDPAMPLTSNNFITIDRYRVRYIRADGRNVEGVDVPFGFDGASTATIGQAPTTISFTLVRVQAKEEAPLRVLAANGNVISTIAEVTFFGRDQAGRPVSISGRISVTFANWGDPD